MQQKIGHPFWHLQVFVPLFFQDLFALLLLNISAFSLAFRTPGRYVFLGFDDCQCLVYMFVYAI